MPDFPDKNYLRQVIRSSEIRSRDHDFYLSSYNEPSVTLESRFISVTNWVEGKCDEVRQKIDTARDLFFQFKALARELSQILSKDVADVVSETRIEALQREMEELRKQILAAYPEIYDSWLINVTMKWKFPKNKIYIDKNLGPLFSLHSVTTPHIQWQSGDSNRKVPESITYETKFPNSLMLVVKSVPSEFCASPFQLQALGSVSGNAMNIIYVHLVTHRSVQFQ